MANTDSIKKALEAAAGPIVRAFQTAEGREALKLLEREFVYGNLCAHDVNQTHVNIGAHAVVTTIRRLVEAAERK